MPISTRRSVFCRRYCRCLAVSDFAAGFRFHPRIEWHPVGPSSQLDRTGRRPALMGESILVVLDADDEVAVTGEDGCAMSGPRLKSCGRIFSLSPKPTSRDAGLPTSAWFTCAATQDKRRPAALFGYRHRDGADAGLGIENFTIRFNANSSIRIGPRL